jgi:XTP/dITP diphosphohydrolase
MNIIVFTNNQKKLKEIKEIFKSLNVEVFGYREQFETNLDVEETGITFEENAILKVNALPHKDECIYIADDSGIEVDVLDGAPGVYSARYAGEGATSESMSLKLLSDVGDAKNRGVQYRCVIAIRFPTKEVTITEGIIRGSVIYKEHYKPGHYGFGYDPIFQPEGYSTDFSNIPTNIKHKISHRGLALKSAYLLVEKFLDKR